MKKSIYLSFFSWMLICLQSFANKECLSGELPENLSLEDWQYNSLNASTSGAAHHYTPDVIASQNNSATVMAKFSYGMFFADLRNELIEIWLDDCSDKLMRIGVVETDDNGMLNFNIPVSFSTDLGVYKLILRVVGDGTVSESLLRVLKENSTVAVYDIDGTISNPEYNYLSYFAEYLTGGGLNVEERKGAPQLTHKLKKRGMTPIYLTARPYFFSSDTKNWLECKNFCKGCLHYPLSTSYCIPTDDAVGEFKARYLDTVKKSGFKISLAFGNSTTDLYAYRKAGIPDNKIYMVGEEFEGEGVQVIAEDYTQLLERLGKNDTNE